jgi:large subunit ribosomal protein L18
VNKKELSRLKRHRRIKMKMHGTDEKPRLVIKRSLNNFSAVVINDTENKVVFSFSTANKEFKQKIKNSGNVKAAEIFGECFPRRLRSRGYVRLYLIVRDIYTTAE